MGARHEQDSTQSRKHASSSGRGETTKDDGDQNVSKIMERERRNLQRACALLDCLRVAVMYDYEEEIDPGDVAYVVRGLISDTVNALDRVELRKAAREHPPEPP
jgi:hypothetical protein